MISVGRLIPADRAWFVFQVSPEENFRILLNRMRPRDAAANRKKFLVTQEDGQVGQDDERWFRFLAEDVIVDWEGITDQDGKPWPATIENRLQLVSAVASFKAFVEQKYVSEDEFRGNAGSGHVSSTTGAQPAKPRKAIRAVEPVKEAAS